MTGISDYVRDELFLTTMLKSPATLLVTSGGVQSQYYQAGGISHVRVPFQVGPQVFELRRGDSHLGVINTPPITTSLTNYNFFPTSGFAYFLDRPTSLNSNLPAKISVPSPSKRQ